MRERIDTTLAGDVDTAKAILRGHIKSTVGFGKPGKETGTKPKRPIRMFGPHGNSQSACQESSLPVTSSIKVSRDRHLLQTSKH